MKCKCTHCSECECDAGAACDRKCRSGSHNVSADRGAPAPAVASQRIGRATENCSEVTDKDNVPLLSSDNCENVELMPLIVRVLISNKYLRSHLCTAFTCCGHNSSLLYTTALLYIVTDCNSWPIAIAHLLLFYTLLQL